MHICRYSICLREVCFGLVPHGDDNLLVCMDLDTNPWEEIFVPQVPEDDEDANEVDNELPLH